MKASALPRYNFYAQRSKAPRYPGCDGIRFSLHKLVDTLLAAAITLAVLLILAALLVL